MRLVAADWSITPSSAVFATETPRLDAQANSGPLLEELRIVSHELFIFVAAKPPKKLTFLYLANDVVQNSKKKGPEFSRDFKTVLPYAYKHTAR